MSHDPDMLPALRSLGDQLAEAGHREPEPSRWRRSTKRRRMTYVAVAGVLAAAGAAGAASLISVGEPIDEAKDVPGGLAPLPQAGAIAVQADDPAGGLPWGVRVYESRSGSDCAVPGRLRGNELGFVQSGRFRPLAGDATGSCGDLDTRPFFVATEASKETPVHTLVYGRARIGVRQIQLAGPDGMRSAKPGRAGAFLFVYRGSVPLSRLRVRAIESGS